MSYKITYIDVAADVIFDIDRIAQKLEQDARQLRDMSKKIKIWADKDPNKVYNKELTGHVVGFLLSLTNNSGWVSSMEAAIRKVNQ